MLTSLAWKNIWRNKKRSLIIVVAIAFGLWGGLVAGAIMMGWGESMVDTAIDRDLAHIQIHNPGFLRDREVTNFIPNGFAVMDSVRKIPGVKAVSGRTLVEGMAASPTSTFGVTIMGIDPDQAKRVTDIYKLLVEGDYFNGKGKNPIVIGQKLADRLSLKIRSKIILSFQGLDSSLTYAAFRVSGIYKSGSSLFDESHVFVRQADLFRLLNTQPIVHEIAIRAESAKLMSRVLAAIQGRYPKMDIKTWKELAPEIAVTADAMISFTYLFVAIILMALIFGITNTMLMAVMERIRELGMLIAIGMKRVKVFVMILLETIMLSFTGGICGMIIGGASIAWLSHTGIDFSAFSSSLESFGIGTMLYPFLPLDMYIALVAMIIVAASIASTVPAWKAVHLVPSQAIRTY